MASAPGCVTQPNAQLPPSLLHHNPPLPTTLRSARGSEAERSVLPASRGCQHSDTQRCTARIAGSPPLLILGAAAWQSPPLQWSQLCVLWDYVGNGIGKPKLAGSALQEVGFTTVLYHQLRFNPEMQDVTPALTAVRIQPSFWTISFLSWEVNDAMELLPSEFSFRVLLKALVNILCPSPKRQGFNAWIGRISMEIGSFPTKDHSGTSTTAPGKTLRFFQITFQPRGTFGRCCPGTETASARTTFSSWLPGLQVSAGQGRACPSPKRAVIRQRYYPSHREIQRSRTPRGEEGKEGHVQKQQHRSSPTPACPGAAGTATAEGVVKNTAHKSNRCFPVVPKSLRSENTIIWSFKCLQEGILWFVFIISFSYQFHFSVFSYLVLVRNVPGTARHRAFLQELLGWGRGTFPSKPNAGLLTLAPDQTYRTSRVRFSTVWVLPSFLQDQARYALCKQTNLF